MKRLRGLCLSLAGLMLMTTPALAADYNFETPAPKDFYGSTSYEEVYGAQYNYGGTNAVDFLDPWPTAPPGSPSTAALHWNTGSIQEVGAFTPIVPEAATPSSGEMFPRFQRPSSQR